MYERNYKYSEEAMRKDSEMLNKVIEDSFDDDKHPVCLELEGTGKPEGTIEEMDDIFTRIKKLVQNVKERL